MKRLGCFNKNAYSSNNFPENDRIHDLVSKFFLNLDAIALPSLAVMMTDAIYDGMFGGEAKGGRHPATFSGYRLAAACSLGFFEILEEEKLLENLIKMSGYFNFQLQILQTTGYPLKNIVVKGLCIAFEIVPKAR